MLDPLLNTGWPTGYVFTDGARFLDCAQRSTRCMLFVDEAGEMIGHHHRELFWCATRARHLGHSSHFLAQRAAMIHPTVRSQCTRLLLFKVSHKDAEELVREWARPEISAAPELEQGECLVVGRFGPIRRLRVFTPR